MKVDVVDGFWFVCELVDEVFGVDVGVLYWVDFFFGWLWYLSCDCLW